MKESDIIKQFASINRCLEKSTKQTDGLMRRVIRNEAYVVMLYGVAREMCQKQSIFTPEAIRENFRKRWKDALHRILVRIEKDNPHLAGLMDDRSFDEIE